MKNKTNFRGFAPIIILILLVLVGVGAYYFGTLKNKIVPVASVQPSTSPVVNPTADPTANWKTYENSNLGVSFRYPSDVFVYESTNSPYSEYWANEIGGVSPMNLSSSGVWMVLTVTPSIDDYAYNSVINKTTPGQWTTVLDETRPNTEGSYSYTSTQLRGRAEYQIFIASFDGKNLDKYKNTFDQILSTFKFTK